MEEMSNSISVSRLSGHNRKPHHYSAKDKLLFNKFSAILQTFSENKKIY